ncbi:CDP-diacylglycerol--glycerol-3-phosphate 3-phosphatidyltransferase [soil metagenome]
MTTEASTPRLWNVPNALSLGRLVVGGFALGLIGYGYYLAALILFILAAISDWFDGYLARKLNQETAFGRQLDPLVDKLVASGFFIYLLTVEGSGLYPWMVTVIVIRELLIQWLRSLLEGQGIAFGAKLAGKLKTTFQFLAIVVILLILSFDAFQTTTWMLIRDILIWLAVGLTIYSGAGYVLMGLPKIREEPPASMDSKSIEVQ